MPDVRVCVRACRQGGSGTLLGCLEEVGVDEDGGAHENTLLVGAGVFWEINLERLRVGEKLGGHGLWLSEDGTDERGIAVGLLLIRWVHAEGGLAAALAARVAFSAAVDAHTAAAGWLVELVHGLAVAVEDLEGWHAVPVVLLDASQRSSIAGEGSHLVAAALTSAWHAAHWTIDGDELGVGVELLHGHLVRMHWRAAEAATAAGLLDGMEDLVVAHEVLELSQGLATEQFLAPSTTSLADVELLAPCHVGLEGIAAAVFHLVGLHLECVWFVVVALCWW
mmetsp:Transcript_20680/g.57468  ORF Transcript_20680/g.57468 Transcript_20680/m.57468 type:complete len:280 (-) Transcript_20680:92-931(-)